MFKERLDKMNIPTISVAKFDLLEEFHLQLIRTSKNINPQTMRDAKQVLTSRTKTVDHMTERNRRQRALSMVQALMNRFNALDGFNDADFEKQQKLYNADRVKLPSQAVFDALLTHNTTGMSLTKSAKEHGVHSMSVHQLKRRMKRYTDYAERLKNTA